MKPSPFEVLAFVTSERFKNDWEGFLHDDTSNLYTERSN